MYWCEKNSLNILTKLSWCRRAYNNRCEHCIFKEEYKTPQESNYQKCLKVIVNLEDLQVIEPRLRNKLIQTITEVAQYVKGKEVANGKGIK